MSERYDDLGSDGGLGLIMATDATAPIECVRARPARATVAIAPPLAQVCARGELRAQESDARWSTEPRPTREFNLNTRG